MKIDSITPTCPYCSEDFVFFDIVDTDYDSNDGTLINIASATCPKCNRDFCWTEVYKYMGYCGLTDLTEK